MTKNEAPGSGPMVEQQVEPVFMGRTTFRADVTPDGNGQYVDANAGRI